MVEMGGHKSCGKWKSFQRKTSKDLNGFYKVRIESKVVVAKKNIRKSKKPIMNKRQSINIEESQRRFITI